MVRDARLRALLTMRSASRPRPEEARSAVSKDGPRARAVPAAHGSRRALCALLTMRCSGRVLARARRCAIRLAAVARNAKPGGRCRPPGAIPTVDFLLACFGRAGKNPAVKNQHGPAGLNCVAAAAPPLRRDPTMSPLKRRCLPCGAETEAARSARRVAAPRTGSLVFRCSRTPGLSRAALRSRRLPRR